MQQRSSRKSHANNWILFYFTEYSVVEMFDFLDKDIYTYSKDIVKFLDKFANRIKVFVNRAQPLSRVL